MEKEEFETFFIKERIKIQGYLQILFLISFFIEASVCSFLNNEIYCEICSKMVF